MSGLLVRDPDSPDPAVVVADGSYATDTERVFWREGAQGRHEVHRVPIGQPVVLRLVDRLPYHPAASHAAAEVTVQDLAVQRVHPSLAQPVDDNPLSTREAQVLLAAREGLTNQQIAQRLGISTLSVQAYLDGAMEKTCTRGRASAVTRALRRGWIT